MTLTEIVQLINRSKKLIIPLFLVVLLAAGGVHLLQQRKLPTEKLPPPSDFGGSNLPPSVQLKSGLKLPRWMDVYQIVEGDIPLTKSWAEAVGETFGFTSPPRISEGKTFIWSDSKRWLSLGEKAEGGRYLRYGLDLLSNPSLVGSKDKVLPSGSEAAEIARQFLVEGGFNSASRLVSSESRPPQLVAVRGPHWVDVSDESEADALRLIMVEKIGEIPIFEPAAEGQGSLVAYVGREGKILKVDYSWGERDYQLFDRYPLRDISDALAAGKVVEVVGEGWESITTELRSLYITSASLGYFADSSAGYVYPIFVFQGSGSGKEGKTFQVTVLAPAVSSKWMK